MNISTLLCPDHCATVIRTAWSRKALPMTAFGFCDRRNFQVHRNGFNGEVIEQATGHYPLGNGHRDYNPHLMRFHSPDTLSPFDHGGLNSYAYCQGDPINWRDPSGRWRLPRWPYWGGFSPINLQPTAALSARLLRPRVPAVRAQPAELPAAAPVITPPAIADTKPLRAHPATVQSGPVRLIDAPAAVRERVLAAASAGARNPNAMRVQATDNPDEQLKAPVKRREQVPLDSAELIRVMAGIRRG